MSRRRATWLIISRLTWFFIDETIRRIYNFPSNAFSFLLLISPSFSLSLVFLFFFSLDILSKFPLKFVFRLNLSFLNQVAGFSCEIDRCSVSRSTYQRVWCRRQWDTSVHHAAAGAGSCCCLGSWSIRRPRPACRPTPELTRRSHFVAHPAFPYLKARVGSVGWASGGMWFSVLW